MSLSSFISVAIFPVPFLSQHPGDSSDLLPWLVVSGETPFWAGWGHVLSQCRVGPFPSQWPRPNAESISGQSTTQRDYGIYLGLKGAHTRGYNNYRAYTTIQYALLQETAVNKRVDDSIKHRHQLMTSSHHDPWGKFTLTTWITWNPPQVLSPLTNVIVYWWCIFQANSLTKDVPSPAKIAFLPAVSTAMLICNKKTIKGCCNGDTLLR